MTPDEQTVGAFTEVLIRRRTMLPDGTTHGTEAAFSVGSDPVSGDLVHAFASMVDKIDRATARGIAEEHGDGAGMDFLDRVSEATARWTEERS